eukprot:TRINITY_DN43576_c0_g1_i1.p1 TRINITY_DN43576_c0_g1~~TRINITY_DN43576_c0_g1_i1.p1  ORF type:complete len:1092 (-),score=209.80 TRINITY_DN43576_c0_g1_i1:28-2856(-)
MSPGEVLSSSAATQMTPVVSERGRGVIHDMVNGRTAADSMSATQALSPGEILASSIATGEVIPWASDNDQSDANAEPAGKRTGAALTSLEFLYSRRCAWGNGINGGRNDHRSYSCTKYKTVTEGNRRSGSSPGSSDCDGVARALSWPAGGRSMWRCGDFEGGVEDTVLAWSPQTLAFAASSDAAAPARGIAQGTAEATMETTALPTLQRDLCVGGEGLRLGSGGDEGAGAVAAEIDSPTCSGQTATLLPADFLAAAADAAAAAEAATAAAMAARAESVSLTQDEGVARRLPISFEAAQTMRSGDWAGDEVESKEWKRGKESEEAAATQSRRRRKRRPRAILFSGCGGEGEVLCGILPTGTQTSLSPQSWTSQYSNSSVRGTPRRCVPPQRSLTFTDSGCNGGGVAVAAPGADAAIGGSTWRKCRLRCPSPKAPTGEDAEEQLHNQGSPPRHGATLSWSSSSSSFDDCNYHLTCRSLVVNEDGGDVVAAGCATGGGDCGLSFSSPARRRCRDRCSGICSEDERFDPASYVTPTSGHVSALSVTPVRPRSIVSQRSPSAPPGFEKSAAIQDWLRQRSASRTPQPPSPPSQSPVPPCTPPTAMPARLVSSPSSLEPPLSPTLLAPCCGGDSCVDDRGNCGRGSGHDSSDARGGPSSDKLQAFRSAVHGAPGLSSALRRDLLEVLNEVRSQPADDRTPAVKHSERGAIARGNSYDGCQGDGNGACRDHGRDESCSGPLGVGIRGDSPAAFTAAAAVAASCGSPTHSDMEAALDAMPTPREPAVWTTSTRESLDDGVPSTPPRPRGGRGGNKEAILDGFGTLDLAATDGPETPQPVAGRRHDLSTARYQFKVSVGATARSGDFRTTMLRELDGLHKPSPLGASSKSRSRVGLAAFNASVLMGSAGGAAFQTANADAAIVVAPSTAQQVSWWRATAAVAATRKTIVAP